MRYLRKGIDFNFFLRNNLQKVTVTVTVIQNLLLLYAYIIWTALQ